MDLFRQADPITQAVLATCFTWFLTAVGAAAVFVTGSLNRKLLDGSLGLSAGVMLAASYWSLLAPAISLARRGGLPAWLPAAAGLLAGGLFLFAADRILPHLHFDFPREAAEGIPTNWRGPALLILAITLHNIPEGLAVGIAFGAAAVATPGADLSAAIALTIGIGLQNLPEGLAVAFPLRRQGTSRLKSFWYGQLSGAVEPAAGLLGAYAVMIAQPLLPYALGFAAGAMIFVVVEEAIPESQRGGNTDLATLGLLAGFLIMMILDVAFA
jgi:ZIP family zinc transporter